MTKSVDENVLQLLKDIESGKWHRCSQSTYDKAIELGLIEYVGWKRPPWGFSGPVREPGWRKI